MSKIVRLFVIFSAAFLLTAVIITVFFRPFVIPWRSEDTVADGGGILLTTQFPVYDKSCEFVTLVIENHSGETAQFGRRWKLEKMVLGQWSAVPFEEMVFTSEGILLPDGGTWAQKCSLTPFIGSIGNGEYRIVKEIGDAVYYAEFSVGESVITAETPFGHEKLENLSLRPDVVPVGNAVTMENGDLQNGGELSAFLEAWTAGGLQYQMRSAYRGDEGQVVLEDVIILDDNKILWQADTRRAPNGMILSEYYSNIVTDGKRLYLSDWNEYRGDGTERVLLNFTLPEEDAKAAVETIEGHGVRERLLTRWSADGMFEAGIFENEIGFTQYYESGGYSGQVISVNRNNLDNPDRMTYVDLRWTKDNLLMVMVRTNPLSFAPMYYYEFMDVEQEKTVSYTTSAHAYRMENGEIVIPE